MGLAEFLISNKKRYINFLNYTMITQKLNEIDTSYPFLSFVAVLAMLSTLWYDPLIPIDPLVYEIPTADAS